jgi:hypothetical protein
MSLHPNARVRSIAEGLTLPAGSIGMTASFSGLTLAAMQPLLGRQGGQAISCGVGRRSASAVQGMAPSLDGRIVAASYGHYIGRVAGSGQCVALVHAVNPNIGPTGSWARGDAVQGNRSLQPGTVIATFESSGRYGNATDGSSHAAIYLGQNEQGVQVMDQWSGSPAAVRTISWTNPSGTAANTGSAFHVVRSG